MTNTSWKVEEPKLRIETSHARVNECRAMSDQTQWGSTPMIKCIHASRYRATTVGVYLSYVPARTDTRTNE